MVKFGAKSTNPDSGSSLLEKTGDYQLVCSSFDINDDGQLVFDFEVVAAAKEMDQIGRKFKAWMDTPDMVQSQLDNGQRERGNPEAAGNAIVRLAIALGLYSNEQWQRDIAEDNEIDLPFEASEDRTFFAKVAVTESKGGNLYRNFKRTWPIGADDAPKMKVNQESIDAAPKGIPAPQEEMSW